MDTRPDAADSATDAPADFSLVLGGPLYQLLLRSRLSGDALTLVHRRIIAAILITWAPLLLLSTFEGRAWWGQVTVPFLLNIETHARFLIALPLLIASELIVHVRMRRVLVQFLARKLIAEEDQPRFTAAIRSAMRLRNSLVAELVLVVLIFAIGIPIRNYLVVPTSTWATGSAGATFSLAGWWQTLISVPIFQFILLRWYFRLLIWIRFLWHVSRIELRLMPLHPDRAGGLGFLSNVVYAFTSFLLAHGVLLAALIGDRIFFTAAKLPQFIVEIAGGVGVLVFMVLCPLLMFAGQLSRAKRAGLREYGVLAQDYVREFDEKWIHGESRPGEPLIGNADIQSLADLGNSFEVVRSMRLAPFSKETVFQLGVVTLAPLLPLLLTMISFEELLKRLLSAVF